MPTMLLKWSICQCTCTVGRGTHSSIVNLWEKGVWHTGHWCWEQVILTLNYIVWTLQGTCTCKLDFVNPLNNLVILLSFISTLYVASKIYLQIIFSNCIIKHYTSIKSKIACFRTSPSSWRISSNMSLMEENMCLKFLSWSAWRPT